jgi:hypothetical protein
MSKSWIERRNEKQRKQQNTPSINQGKGDITVNLLLVRRLQQIPCSMNVTTIISRRVFFFSIPVPKQQLVTRFVQGPIGWLSPVFLRKAGMEHFLLVPGSRHLCAHARHVFLIGAYVEV